MANGDTLEIPEPKGMGGERLNERTWTRDGSAKISEPDYRLAVCGVSSYALSGDRTGVFVEQTEGVL